MSAERVREHVDGCRQCAATLEALDAVQGQLGSLPTPAIPAVVAARLDAALTDLRTERPLRIGGRRLRPRDDWRGPASAAAAGCPGRSSRPPRRWW
jgi:hypothetical protein